ncbi:TetR/AcrR family transcriptional regulator [Flexivirga sp. ID2601S]|uniref:TetR/AcrR family transcriptional regulator n=1 Tax=Flexivirga aerilata TaxID=1656889 RepID=A0A849AEA1_9MICO|nr:TetR/AcrR family transcriptional regulator [Flexivirga aerilata]NNG38237.1 TetR/AcrR family transcriptional regulator [Flexivirga aerilata]
MTNARATGIRARARVETTARIKDVARRHLAEHGADLSLRAVARDVGMVSSAVYRYFDSRDALLTALIVDAYEALADAADAAEATAPRDDFAGRWIALADGIRGWAVAHPHEYALLYGSPVPGYAAPPATIEPASRPVVTMVTILGDAVAAGRSVPDVEIGGPVAVELRGVLAALGSDDVPEALLLRGLIAWEQLFGALSFDLFGRFQGAFEHKDDLWRQQLLLMTDYLGLRG